MRYMLLIYGDEKAFAGMAPDARNSVFEEYEKYSAWLVEKGWMRAGDPLADTDQATTVRQADGKVLSTDGPFAETKEQLGGYYLIDARDLNDAIQVASRIPSARYGSIEVRPIMEFSEAAV